MGSKSTRLGFKRLSCGTKFDRLVMVVWAVPFTLLAEVQIDLLGDSLGDVHCGPEARHTHVGWVWGDGDATGAAQAKERNHSLISTVYQLIPLKRLRIYTFTLKVKDNYL